ncbi:hypothetical protein [Ruegeria arenilitoris]|uniref:hypothetical protein n=1 Tax=Ruegeria arenilitoris TaxID=1173585 RepID=UPI00147D99D4|nr:hypothetical protein [Ruegeria arenilitoris]
MDLISEDTNILDKFVGENSFLDTEIEEIRIFGHGSLAIVEIQLLMRPQSDWKKVLLRFCGCESYNFHHSSDCAFGIVERFKFIVLENDNFYMSFDPYDDSEIVSPEDNDVVYSQSIQAYILARK